MPFVVPAGRRQVGRPVAVDPTVSDRFEAHRLARPSDGQVRLRLEQLSPADPGRGWVPCYHFAIDEVASGAPAGVLRFRVGDVRTTPSLLTSGHIGYGIEPAFRGHHYAERACRLVGPLAIAHGVRPVIIGCDPSNGASRRTCERLGARLVGVFDIPPDHSMYADGRRQSCRFEWDPEGAVSAPE